MTFYTIPSHGDPVDLLRVHRSVGRPEQSLPSAVRLALSSYPVNIAENPLKLHATRSAECTLVEGPSLPEDDMTLRLAREKLQETRS